MLFIVSGSVRINDQSIVANTLAVLSADDRVSVSADEDSQCFLIAATKLHEPIVRHGPFVMNTQEEIIQAVTDFQAGRF